MAEQKKRDWRRILRSALRVRADPMEIDDLSGDLELIKNKRLRLSEVPQRGTKRESELAIMSLDQSELMFKREAAKTFVIDPSFRAFNIGAYTKGASQKKEARRFVVRSFLEDDGTEREEFEAAATMCED